MRIEWKNIVAALVMFIGGAIYFFLKSAGNTNGLIINGIFTLNVSQANTFYVVMGCLCIVLLALCGVGVYVQNKQ